MWRSQLEEEFRWVPGVRSRTLVGVTTGTRSVGSLLCGVMVAGASAGVLALAIRFASNPASRVAARPSSLDAEAGPALPLDLGPEDRAYRELLTPSSSPPGTFAVYRSALDLASLTARLSALDAHPAAGAWEVQKTDVFDAFGSEGPYDKGRLARLFGGSSPRAARGSLLMPYGRVAVALISPYPDLALTSLLRQGTLVIVTRLPTRRF
jgi:hypothetical protein